MSTKQKNILTSPVRAGDSIDLPIHRLGHRGEGVGRYEGMVVFVPGAVLGDHVRAQVVEVERGYARAVLESIALCRRPTV